MTRRIQLLCLAVLLLAAPVHAATYISKGTGNTGTAGTWAQIATASSAELDSEAGNTACTTSYVASSTFVPGNAAVDGVAVKVASVVTGAGTVSVSLANVTSAGTREGTTTLLIADFLSGAPQGWIFFKFASSVTPNGTDTYNISFKCTGAGTVNLYRDGTAGNWDRMLRLTTSPGSAPVAGDKLIMIGEWVPDTLTSFTVTWNDTTGISFGPTVSGGPADGMVVGQGATVNCATTTSTAYTMKWKGRFHVFGGGTETCWTSSATNPSGSTATLTMASVANVDSGLYCDNGGTCIDDGAVVTYVNTLLTADAANGDTTITTADSTGWLSGDSLAIGSTSTANTDVETKALSGNCTGTSCPIAALGTANQTGMCSSPANCAHSGTSPTQAEVVNLTRKVLITGASASLQGYIYCAPTATCEFKYAGLTDLGSATTGKRGVDAATTTGSFIMDHCAEYSFGVAFSRGFYASGATSNNYTYTNNVTYLISGNHVANDATTGTNWTVSGNVLLNGNVGSTSAIATFSDVGGTITNNTVVGSSGLGMLITDVGSTIGTFSGNVAHSNVGGGFEAIGVSGTASNNKAWYNVTTGWIFLCGVSEGPANFTVDGDTLFGNTAASIDADSGSGIVLHNITSNGTTFSATPSFLRHHCTIVSDLDILVDGSTLDVAAGSGGNARTAHTQDFNWVSTTTMGRVEVNNTTLSAATLVNGQANVVAWSAAGRPGSQITFDRFNATDGAYKARFKGGNIILDDTNFRTADPGETLVGNSASVKLESERKQIAVNNGNTVTPTVWVCQWSGNTACTASGVPASCCTGNNAGSCPYTGNFARLILKKNPTAGITSDTVLATASSTTGTCAGSGGSGWQSLSGTTPAVTGGTAAVGLVLEFVVDVDTAGAVTIDDWSTN